MILRGSGYVPSGLSSATRSTSPVIGRSLPPRLSLISGCRISSPWASVVVLTEKSARSVPRALPSTATSSQLPLVGNWRSNFPSLAASRNFWRSAPTPSAGGCSLTTHSPGEDSLSLPPPLHSLLRVCQRDATCALCSASRAWYSPLASTFSHASGFLMATVSLSAVGKPSRRSTSLTFL